MRLGGGREGGKWRARVGSVLDIQYTSLSLVLLLPSAMGEGEFAPGTMPVEV